MTMSNLAPAVSVVIPARNAAHTLDDQLEALAGQEFDEPWELIVVDNGSTDATADIVRRRAEQLPALRVVNCDRRGINCARNAGVHAARGDRILLCDADDVVAAGWLRTLAGALGEWDVVGGMTETGTLNDHSVQRSRGNPVSGTLPTAHRFMTYAIGANMGFRRDVFDRIGGFDEAFTKGSDEIDFCWRAQYAGFRLGFAGEAIVHYRLRARPSEVLRQSYAFARANSQLYAKHRELGHLPRPPAGQQLRKARQRIRSVVRVYRVAQKDHRLSYARNLGRALGAAAGFARYRIVA
jgi:glycosyltransferase involved in cell wall biosynthesis